MNINFAATFANNLRRVTLVGNSLQTVAPFRNSISTSFIILPLAHIRFGYTAIQLLVFHDEARV